jgi:hypothetical protein
MKLLARAVSFVVAAAAAVCFAMRLALLLEQDACLDAGGTYIAATGACETAAAYVALFARPHVYALWAGLLIAAFVVGGIAHAIVARMFGSALPRD